MVCVWAEGRRYLGLDILARSHATDNNPSTEQAIEPTLQTLTA